MSLFKLNLTYLLPVYYLYIMDLIVWMFILHNNCIPHEYCN